jgi:DNA-binding IclR family transcriptional regulator
VKSKTNSDAGRAANSPNYGVPALEKGLDVLECLAAARGGLSQTELARALGRTPSELFRMLNCLERRGYVARDANTGAFSLTLRLFELSHTHSPYQQLVAVATKPMRDLTAAIRESCHLGVLHHGELLLLAQEETTQKVRLSIEVGSTSPVLQTASGRLLLACLPLPQQREALEANASFLALSVARRRALQARLAAIGEQGYEAALSESVEGVFDVAVPVGRPGGAVRATLAVAALPRKGEPGCHDRAEAILGPLRACAAAIERAAGLAETTPDAAAGSATP